MRMDAASNAEPNCFLPLKATKRETESECAEVLETWNILKCQKTTWPKIFFSVFPKFHALEFHLS